MHIEFTPRGILAVLFRQRRIVLTLFFGIVLAGIAYILLATPKYDGTGSLLVKFGEGASPDISNSGRSMHQELSQNDRREIMQSNSQILQSRDLLTALVNEIGPEEIYPGITAKSKGKETPTEMAVRKLWTSDLNVQLGQQSNVMEVHLFARSPELAKRMVERLFALYLVRQAEVYNKPQTNFLAEQVARAKSELEESQQALTDFKAREGISSIEEELAQLMRDKGDVSSIAYQNMDEARGRLAELEAKEAEMLTTYRPDSPAVRQLRKSIAVTRGQIGARQADLRASAPAGAKKGGALSTQVSSIDKRIAQLEAKRSEYNDLARQVAINEEKYKNYVLRGEDARISDVLNQQNISRIVVVDEPTASLKAARPRKLVALIISLLTGTLLSIGMAMARETLDERFTTPEHVTQRLGVPVMATFGAGR